MNFDNFGPVIFFCTIIAGGVLFYERKKAARKQSSDEQEFWAREAKANETRRKDITFLNYIKIPVDTLPMEPSDNEEIRECQDTISILSQSRVLNLQGISNTDLKLEYGVANLPLLTEYDENYTVLLTTLVRWGEKLMEDGQTESAVTVLEYGISLNTDISKNYFLLADFYRTQRRPEEIERLIETASKISTVMKGPIIKKLNEFLEYAGN